MPVFTARTELPHPRHEVFRWHARIGAFQRLLPPWEDVRVLGRDGEMAEGAEVALEIRKGPARVRWELRHTAYEEGRLFRDEQVRGPFARWIHEHRFEDSARGGCIVEDHVEWEPPLGATGRLLAGSAGQAALARAFRFRHSRLSDDLARHAGWKGPPLTVAVTGSTGFVGSALVDFLTSGGHAVRRVVRGRPDPGRGDVYWSVKRGALDVAGLEGVDAVIHLAGEPIVGVRWTAAKKRAILDSRVEGTRLMARALAGLSRPPRVLVCSSGVHFYGDGGDRVLTEESPAGKGFLAEVCRRWEAAADPARLAGIRVVHLRTGVAVSPAGGVLGVMLLPFNLGVGGRIGSGRQYLSWIDHDDLLGLIHHMMGSDALAGPVNGTSPHPVSNATFTTTLGRVLRRPTLLPLPASAVRAAMGQMGEELLLSGVRVRPAKALESGFEFFRPGLEDSLRFQLGRFEDLEQDREAT